MAETKSKSALTHALAGLLAAAASWLVSHAVTPAQAAQPGLATSAQVEALERKVDRFIDRVQAVELEQAKQQGAQNAAHRERAR